MRPLSFGCSARSAYPKVRRLTFPSFVGCPLDEGGDVAKKILWNEEAVKQGAEELDPGDLHGLWNESETPAVRSPLVRVREAGRSRLGALSRAIGRCRDEMA
jgi:hypothetical protein